MQEKVILMSIDGMRSDGFLQCKNPFIRELTRLSTYTLQGCSVNPTVTLPCHTSVFTGVEPSRHGIVSNTFVPQVHHVKSLFEKMNALGKTTAMFYGWEPIRDVAPPGTLTYSQYINAYTDESVDTLLTDKAIQLISDKKPDFCFLYQVDTDEKGGHDNGWMSDEYLRRVNIAVGNAKRVIEKFGNEYSVIIFADHGGHDRMHGTMCKEDYTVPFFFYGKPFERGKEISGVSLLDIAPTVAKIMGFDPEREWTGKSIV